MTHEGACFCSDLHVVVNNIERMRRHLISFVDAFIPLIFFISFLSTCALLVDVVSSAFSSSIFNDRKQTEQMVASSDANERSAETNSKRVEIKLMTVQTNASRSSFCFR